MMIWISYSRTHIMRSLMIRGSIVAVVVADNDNNNNNNNNNNNKGGPVYELGNVVRAEVLKLLWSVLTHPDASSLKSYDILKQYVTRELRVEPGGKEHRETYLRSCISTLTENSKRQTVGTVDEIRALKMVKLTHFVFEACPRIQAADLVTNNQGELPLLLFEELKSFLKRKQQIGSVGIRPQTPPRKSPSIDSEGIQATIWLSERLRILRYVYGVSEQIYMNTVQIHSLWQLCSVPADREEVMAFIASASGTAPDRNNNNVDGRNNRVADPSMTTNQGNNNNTMIGPIAEDVLSSAFKEDVCARAFVDLFCSSSISFQQLGEKAYRSFHFMFNKMRLSATHGSSVRQKALDTLWRICLVTGNDVVAASAMNDLLNIYIGYTVDHNFGTNNNNNPSPEPMQTESNDESFGKRVFDCLSKVKKSLDRKEPSAELAAERCLRILNTAIGQDGSSGSITLSTLNRISRLTPSDGLSRIMKCLPHGMRGQACYRKITVTAKRPQMQHQQGQHNHQERVQSNSNPQRDWCFPLDVHPLETMHSIKCKVASFCQFPVDFIKLANALSRVSSSATRKQTGDGSTMAMHVVPDDTVADEIGLVQGCEIIVMISDRHVAQQNIDNPASARVTRNGRARDLSDIFCDDSNGFSDDLFSTLLGVLESIPWRETDEMTDSSTAFSDPHKLVWDLLLAMPTNPTISTQVLSTVKNSDPSGSGGVVDDEDAMDIDSRLPDHWATLLDLKNFPRSVYVLLAIDAFLQPATEILSSLPEEQRKILERETNNKSADFRRGFIDSGGFDAVVGFFSFSEDSPEMSQSMTRRGNAVALRILKCCLFRDNRLPTVNDIPSNGLDVAGSSLLQSLTNAEGLLRSLTSMVVADIGISSSTASDVLKFLCLLFKSPETVKSFACLPDSTPEKFLIRLLLWEGGSEDTRPGSSSKSISRVRRDTYDLVLSTPLLADYALTWFKNAIDSIEVTSECTSDYFRLLIKLVADSNSNVSQKELTSLATAVCLKLAACPRPSSETVVSIDFPTGVLCGCLALLEALIENVDGSILSEGTNKLLQEFTIARWSDRTDFLATNFLAKPNLQDIVLIDLTGVIFDAFLSPGGATSILAICCNEESRKQGFNVVKSAARSCKDGNGYTALVYRINELVSAASPFLKHRWGQSAGGNESSTRNGRNTSKYSGLKNQGCTCYMNSVLQQLFMMPELRKSLCSAPLPASIRSSGGVVSARGAELVNKKVAMQWESGQSYSAVVEAFDSTSGMHTIKYCPIPIANRGSNNEQNVRDEDIDKLPPLLSEEFFLSEGRPGKESGVFEVLPSESTKEQKQANTVLSQDNNLLKVIKETEDESSSRHLMEEVQRTFIHLEEGSRGRCFDPRALVEACACLKLEFDVWQQNDASEFSTKLLDRLEISMKRWAPDHFKHLDHAFGLKQTKQKICKECGLKSNREEKLLNVDCQIRGKSDIHEALSTMCEIEIMEGNNQVFCDNCKKNTDTVLRSAISELPNMLILSLKRFDLDYNTFETVKLNSRCAFDQTLNMKRYTLEGVEAIEHQADTDDNQEGDGMDVGNDESAMSHLPDEDYEYKLAGVLVHAGVAQGGHYYSFINDRNLGSEDKWYRFDDEDVTPFDSASIASECFGGKVKKETKWPNGQVHSVESEQFANALMLFYEKVKITEPPASSQEKIEPEDTQDSNNLNGIHMTTGYDVFEPDVRRSNATHRWQSFLFDDEFQTFLRSLLHLCSWPDRISNQSMDITGNSESTDTKKPLSWRKNLIEMLVTYLFDVLLYSNNRSNLLDWTNILKSIMTDDRECARELALRVASKTLSVSGNWLRTYLLDCPIYQARIAFVHVLVATLRSCLAIPEEERKLKVWIQAWEEQVSQINMSNDPYPRLLEGKFAEYENLQSPSASIIGIILSFLNVLIDALPRSWKQYQEFFVFIRNLIFIDPKDGGSLFRHAMIKSLIPARMLCFVSRHLATSHLKAKFPGATVSMDVAETQSKQEQSQNLGMNGNQEMNPSDINFRGNSDTCVYTPLFEPIGVLMGIPRTIPAALLVKKEDPNGHQGMVLSATAQSAFTKIFEESCDPSVQGMGQREIEEYLHRCGNDQVPQQRIVEIISKYNTMTCGGNTSKGRNYLNLIGFLAYYKDTAQRDERKVRNDLYTHGFRTDLSRRPPEYRIALVDGREETIPICESIARDVALEFDNRDMPTLGQNFEHGLLSFEIFLQLTPSTTEQLTEYIIAAGFLKRSFNYSKELISSTLKHIYRLQPGWNGQEYMNTAIVILKTLSCIPDDDQGNRIKHIMLCSDKLNEQNHPIGLLRAAETFRNHRPRSSGSYSHEVFNPYERYIQILKVLTGVRPIMEWMEENSRYWDRIDRDLFEQQYTHHNHSRGDYSGRRDNDDVGNHSEHNHQSDSDGMHGINESDQEYDDDSHLDDRHDITDQYCDISKVIVSYAGNGDVNGVYKRDGVCEGVPKFSKHGLFKGNDVTYSLFKCNVSNNTQHWYISVVPNGTAPGTSNDIDFYSASVTLESQILPPSDTWMKANEGISPNPQISVEKDPVQVPIYENSPSPDEHGVQEFV
mmetsp:Transcript_30169/g.34628  ORF Transcript_30169/g.34628 Transcript_30169/m.34628 type:complete len:2567 (+) Transcript_30169:24-7724(+)